MMQDLKVRTCLWFDEQVNPVPFDGKRMIYGGFATVVEM